jgi:protein-disulfide isomerase
MALRKGQKQARKAERMEAEQRAAAADRRRKLLAGVGAAALAAVVVVVALVAISQSGDDAGGEVAGAGLVDSELAGLDQSGTVLGDADAEVRIVEFGDLQCPACAGFSESVVPELLSGPVGAGDAQLEFRNFNIIGPDSETASRAALAASEQDRYWQFVEIFYRNQGAENSGYVSDEFLTEIAVAAGVEDIDAWNQSRADARWDATLAEIQQQAAEAGFTGTPSVLVEGPGGVEPLGTPGSAAEIEEAIGRVG